MDTATEMEFSFWKEEPLSPVFSGLEYQTDVWALFEDDVAKQPKIPEDGPVDTLGGTGGWLPDSPGDSCDSMENLKIEDYIHRAQLASQLLQDLDEVLIKEEPFADPWYEQKTDLPIFDELPSPTPSLCKEGEPLAAAAQRPFCGLSMPLNGYVTPPPAFTAPAAPGAVLVPLSTAQQQAPLAESLQALGQPDNEGLLAVVQLQSLHGAQQHLPAIQDNSHALQDTQQLLQEFDFVFGKVEQSHGGALTPPQSPPHQQYAGLEYRPAPTPQAADDFAALTPTQQQQQLIREVDELEDTRIVQQQAEPWPQLASFAPPSPCTSSNSSSCSFSSDSPAPASPETGTDDPEWLPGDSPVDEAAGPGKAPAKKRAAKRAAKPYSHEDKRSRKKEQNKNAATRYRMKKKAEVEEILGEENELKAKNDELHSKVADLSQEIRYLKNLMREVFVRRGLLK